MIGGLTELMYLVHVYIKPFG